MTPRALHVHAIGAAVIGVVSLAAFVVVVAPVLRMRTERVAMERELAEQRRQADDLDRKQGRLEKAMRHIERQLRRSEIQLQSSRHLNARIAHIIEQADKGDLDVHETRPGTVRDHPRYQTVPILLSGRGTYPNCAAFLHRLRESLPDTGVVEFELTGRPADPLAPASFRFNLVWYAGPVAGQVP